VKFTNAKRGAAITVKVSPRAPKTELAGLMDDGTLKIRLAAPPVDGAANRALVDFLSQALDLPRSQIDIIAGETSERKLISLVGISPEEVDKAFRDILAGRAPSARRGDQRRGGPSNKRQ
jgi:uncharacterized protein (TIGR00251 family)